MIMSFCNMYTWYIWILLLLLFVINWCLLTSVKIQAGEKSYSRGGGHSQGFYMTRLLNEIMSLQCLDMSWPSCGDILVERPCRLYPMSWGNGHPTVQMALVVYHFADLMLQTSQTSSNFWTLAKLNFWRHPKSAHNISKTGIYTKRHCVYGLDPACSDKFDIVIGSAIISCACNDSVSMCLVRHEITRRLLVSFRFICHKQVGGYVIGACGVDGY